MLNQIHKQKSAKPGEKEDHSCTLHRMGETPDLRIVEFCFTFAWYAYRAPAGCYGVWLFWTISDIFIPFCINFFNFLFILFQTKVGSLSCRGLGGGAKRVKTAGHPRRPKPDPSPTPSAPTPTALPGPGLRIWPLVRGCCFCWCCYYCCCCWFLIRSLSPEILGSDSNTQTHKSTRLSQHLCCVVTAVLWQQRCCDCWSRWFPEPSSMSRRSWSGACYYIFRYILEMCASDLKFVSVTMRRTLFNS